MQKRENARVKKRNKEVEKELEVAHMQVSAARDKEEQIAYLEQAIIHVQHEVSNMRDTYQRRQNVS